MIAITELRIGNIVLKRNPNYNNLYELCQVFHIGDNVASLKKLRKYVDFDGKVNDLPEMNKNRRHIISQNPVDCSLLKPVNITEDLLIRCGFKSTKDDYTFIKNIRSNINVDTNIYDVNLYRHESKDFSVELVDCNVDDVKKKHSERFNYLHNLQNIYYEFTKIELNINLQ